ncbi:MAG TPA: hypothetical protein VFO75_00825 [Candidatus Dormibacteraeota bacterium]|nr:hypothetical protein [Candidatus Dormibacteraeota bacterium]
MKFMSPAKLRRVMPLAVVTAILAVAYMAPLPADASKTNNCGVKAGYGYAFHDHGKPCPNRPFPGKGKGIANFPAVTGGTSSPSGGSPASVLSDNDAQSLNAPSDTTADGKGHGHGKALGHERGRDRD